VSDAVAATRLHDQLLPLPTKTFFENGTWAPGRGLPPGVVERLEQRGQLLEPQHLGLGVSQAVAVRYDGGAQSAGQSGRGVLVAMSDARKDGAPYGAN
jgi:gamma-glutamyltranspeptidase